jgi:hypothetical protein
MSVAGGDGRNRNKGATAFYAAVSLSVCLGVHRRRWNLKKEKVSTDLGIMGKEGTGFFMLPHLCVVEMGDEQL